MRRLVAIGSLLFVVACAGAPAGGPGREPAPAAQLRTSLSIREPATTGAVRAASNEKLLREQMRVARELADRVDRRFLSGVEKLPFVVGKAPWLDRPVIELSLAEVRIEPAKEGSNEPAQVKLALRLVADLPDVGVTIDRKLSYERALAEPPDPAAPERSLGPAVEEAAALAAAWLVEAATPPVEQPE